MSTTTTTSSASATSQRLGLVRLRVGLVLGAVLSGLQIQTGVGLWRAEGFQISTGVLVFVPIVALVAIVLAWRGAFSPRLVAVVGCLVPALMGLPAYFIPGIPVMGVLLASLGIFWALVVAVLLLQPGRRAR